MRRGSRKCDRCRKAGVSFSPGGHWLCPLHWRVWVLLLDREVHGLDGDGVVRPRRRVRR